MRMLMQNLKLRSLRHILKHFLMTFQRGLSHQEQILFLRVLWTMWHSLNTQNYQASFVIDFFIHFKS